MGHVSFTSFFDGAIYFAHRFRSSPRCYVRGKSNEYHPDHVAVSMNGIPKRWFPFTVPTRKLADLGSAKMCMVLPFCWLVWIVVRWCDGTHQVAVVGKKPSHGVLMLGRGAWKSGGWSGEIPDGWREADTAQFRGCFFIFSKGESDRKGWMPLGGHFGWILNWYCR